MKSTKPIPDRAYRGTRISWKEFYRQRPDLRPANDNKSGAARSGTASRTGSGVESEERR